MNPAVIHLIVLNFAYLIAICVAPVAIVLYALLRMEHVENDSLEFLATDEPYVHPHSFRLHYGIPPEYRARIVPPSERERDVDDEVERMRSGRRPAA
jgi:hypothetical protein